MHFKTEQEEKNIGNQEYYKMTWLKMEHLNPVLVQGEKRLTAQM